MAKRANFFTNRVSNDKNKQSEDKNMANNINTFKNRVDLDLKGYYSSKKCHVLPYVTRFSLQLLLNGCEKNRRSILIEERLAYP